jgi:preprotein translocase subunit SecF
VFRILKNPDWDFVGRQHIWFAVSGTLVLLSAIVLGVKGIRKGIEFTGGTEVQVKFADTPDLGRIRSSLTRAGLPNHLVTTIGAPEENEVYIRLGIAAGEKEEDLAPRVQRALRPPELEARRQQGLQDLNTVDEATLRQLLEVAPGLGREEAARVAAAILEARKERFLFRSVEELKDVAGVTAPVLEFLRQRAFTGPFSVLSQSYIGPAIGRELVRKAWLAVAGSLAGILLYIGVRFRFQWGVAAVAALVHDTVIAAGLFSFFDRELTLPVIASFLTLIGYSVNDTVVVFDRIRENLKLRGQMKFEDLVNLSINQTLSRTLITSGLTWITTLALFVFGGEALRSFSLVLTVGIVVGTWSSISVASPLVVLWRRYLERRRGTAVERPPTVKPASGPKPAAARKARPNRA